jgi:hypothetical protein
VNPEVLEKLLQEAQKESQSPLIDSLPLAMPLVKSFDSFSAITSSNHTSTIASDMTVLSKSPNSSFQEVDKMRKSTTAAPNSNNNSTSSAATSSAISQSQAIKTSASDQVFMPIKNVHQSTMFVYDDELYCGDEDDSVDLEYAEEENDEAGSDNTTSNKKTSSPTAASNNTFTDTTGSNLMTRSVKEQQKQSKDHAATCKHCAKHRSEITHLLEKQIAQEKEIIKLRNENEIKLLNKSLEISQSSSKSKFMTSSPSPLSPPSLSSTSGITTPIYAATKTAEVDSASQPINTKDWMKYFASRPQSQPPKEWNLVHPNHHAASSKSLRSLDEKQPVQQSLVSTEYAEAANYNIMGSVKLLNGAGIVKEGMSLSKIIFTHVASFIVGATL